MKTFLVIVNSSNKKFSTLKVDTPKMVNDLKEICTKYESLFNDKFKVRRCIITRKGISFI